MKRQRRRVLFGFVAIALVAASTGCGSAGVTGGGSTSTADLAACVSTSQTFVDGARAAIPVKLPKAPLNLSKIKGKNVWLINLANNQFLEDLGSGFTAAAKAAGMVPHVFFGDGSAQSWNNGVATAEAQNADGIVLVAINPTLVSAPLATALSHHTTVIDISNGSPTDPIPSEEFAHVTSDYRYAGKAFGSWMLANSGCKVNAVIFGANVLQVQVEDTGSTASTITSSCKSCKAIMENIDFATLATQLAPQVANVVRREGNINYIMAADDGLVPIIEPAIQGQPLKIVSYDGVASNLAAIRNGTGHQVADVAAPPTAWQGWAAVDQLARGISGESAQDWTIPLRLVDKTNVGASDSAIWPGWDNFMLGFTKAWAGN